MTLPAACIDGTRAALTLSNANIHAAVTEADGTKTLTMTVNGFGQSPRTLGSGNDWPTLDDVVTGLAGMSVTAAIHQPYRSSTAADLLRVQTTETAASVMLAADARCQTAAQRLLLLQD